MTSITLAFYFGIVAGLVLAVAFIWWWKQRGGYHRQLQRVVNKISNDSLDDVIIPDGVEGEIHLDQLLLTSKGLLVLDVREIKGRLYGGDNMDEWTVIHESQRFTFTNPAGPLRERIIAVKTLLKDVPVEGRVVVIGDAKFSDGLPECVVDMSALLEQFGPVDKRAKASVNAFYPYWDRLRQIATSA